MPVFLGIFVDYPGFARYGVLISSLMITDFLCLPSGWTSEPKLKDSIRGSTSERIVEVSNEFGVFSASESPVQV